MVIVAILGKSGCGKSTLEKAFEKVGYNRMISYTTREMRQGETNHKEYHFITKEQFERLYNSGIIIEKAEYNNNFYGIPKPIGYERNVVVVETDGLEQLKKLYGSQVFGVYMNVPEEITEQRLNKRNNTTDRDNRRKQDELKFKDIENKVDLIIDGTSTPTILMNNIVIELNRRGLI